MKKKLSLLIVHYHESEQLIKRALDSIKMQHNVNFDEIEVIVGNDGNDMILSDELFNGYPFDLRYEVFEKRGISSCRNRLLEKAKGEYIIWIDGDDFYLNVLGIWSVMKEINNGGFDALFGNFVTEFKNPQTGEFVYQEMQMGGLQFVHNKYYRRKFLIDNEICFRENYPLMDCHEDHVIAALTRAYTQNIKFNPLATYMWAHNDESVSRKDPYYLPHTTKYLLMNNSWVLEKLYKRGKLQELRQTAYSMAVDMYYSLASDKWLEDSTKADREECEGYFKFYWDKYGKYANELKDEEKKQIEAGQKIQHTQQGLTFETYTWAQWWKHMEDVTPNEFEIRSKN